MLDVIQSAVLPAHSTVNNHAATLPADAIAMPERSGLVACVGNSLATVSNHIIAGILEGGGEEAVWQKGVEPSTAQFLEQRIAQMAADIPDEHQTLQALVKYQWIDSTRLQLVQGCLSQDVEHSKPSLQVLAVLIHIAEERELLVSDLVRRASSYGLELAHEVKTHMNRLDQEGMSRFTTAVQRCEDSLRSFEGPTCDELARSLLAHCLKKPACPVEPEKVNDFTSMYYRASRLQTTELSESARKSIFEMAIAREWMGPREGRDLKYFLSRKPHVGWPIMHALKALCQEIRHRDDLISEIKQNGGSIIEGIEKLKDVVSKAASGQFYRLCQQQSNK